MRMQNKYILFAGANPIKDFLITNRFIAIEILKYNPRYDDRLKKLLYDT